MNVAIENLRIEPFAPNDKAQLIAFIEALQEFEREAVPELKRGADIAWAYAEDLISAGSCKNGTILLARLGTDTIGFVAGRFELDDDPLLAESARLFGYVSDIFVAEKWRSHGVGRCLLQAIEAAMAERDCPRVRIASKAANTTAVRSYQGAGYRPYEITFAKTIATPPARDGRPADVRKLK